MRHGKGIHTDARGRVSAGVWQEDEQVAGDALDWDEEKMDGVSVCTEGSFIENITLGEEKA